MATKKKEITQKDNVTQAVVVVDTFGDEFIPITEYIPHALLPLLNKPLIDYTLEFLSLGGVEETFLFCCTQVEVLRKHINNCIQDKDGWTLRMKVNFIVSESCQSFGDCLRDLDAKGLLRGDFVLIEPGTISNIQLLPLLKKHSDITKQDKGAAMTLILQEAGVGYIGRCPQEEILIATDDKNRILYHKKLGKTRERRVVFPLEMFLENPSVSLLHNLKDTHIAICSSSVLPLYSDNFDFQTKDDFVRGLLMNEEILGSTVYCHITKGSEFGGSVTNWRMYQAISHELSKRWIHPLVAPSKRNKFLKNDNCVDINTKIPENSVLQRSVLGADVVLGNNVNIEGSFIYSNTRIGDDVVIIDSVIGQNCSIESKTHITASIIGNGCIIEEDTAVDGLMIKAEEPDRDTEYEVLGKRAYSIKSSSEADDDGSVSGLITRISNLHTSDVVQNESEDDDFEDFSDTDTEDLSHTESPPPDDTKLFYTEVIESLTRGFEDKLLCDNLVLEINSSRYAYNVTVKEVNFYVIRSILTISLRQPFGSQYYQQLHSLLSYFAPVLKNYIRDKSAMFDCLQAIEDVATTNENIETKWVVNLLNYFYDKDYIAEEAILGWFEKLDANTKFYSQVKPFVVWLNEAEEDSSEEDDD